jgi:hypothetical protein
MAPAVLVEADDGYLIAIPGDEFQRLLVAQEIG